MSELDSINLLEMCQPLPSQKNIVLMKNIVIMKNSVIIQRKLVPLYQH